MNDGTADQLRVSFPAAPVFTRIGRVTVAGLALRLGIEVAMVERLRLAVDAGCSALSGDGQITLTITWQPGHLVVLLVNPKARLRERSALADELYQLLDSNGAEGDKQSVRVETDNVVLELDASAAETA